MVDIRYHALAATSLILAIGTAYSVLYSTYLDTSNPLLTNLAHPLSKTHYFATKSNPLNVYFIKRAWGWTSVVFAFTFVTSPYAVRTKDRIIKFLVLTSAWLLFTSWFFGPALLERVIIYSGGECVATLPSGDHITVPTEYCYQRSTLTAETHPDYFLSTSFADPPDVIQSWRVTPRLRRGHDVSGHIFLLTVSILFLADQLRPSFSSRVGSTAQWSTLHTWAVAAQISLIIIWFLSVWTTGVYFHSPIEKLTGYLLGVATFALSQLPF